MRKIIGGLNGIIALRLLAGGGRQEQYLLRDEFTDTLAAGAVHGTKATDGINTRTVVDTESKLSVAGGTLLFAGGKAIPGFGDPGIWYPAISRVPGRILISRVAINAGASNTSPLIGFSAAQSGIGAGPLLIYTATTLKARTNNVTGPVIDSAPTGTYLLAIVVRAAGAAFFTKSFAHPAWTLLWLDGAGNTGTLYPYVEGYTSALNADCLRIPTALWLPTPLASDGFSAWGTTNGLGHAEGVAGGIGSGGGGKTWMTQLGAFGVTGGKAQATALDGTTGSAVATIDAGTINAIVGCDLGRSAGSVGIMLRYVNADNHVRASHDGTNAMLIKRVAGADTTVITAAATYAANARMVVIADGTSFQVFYNNVKIGSTSTISDAVLQTSIRMGIRTTDMSNTHDNFVVWARGTEGQYNILNRWSN